MLCQLCRTRRSLHANRGVECDLPTLLLEVVISPVTGVVGHDSVTALVVPDDSGVSSSTLCRQHPVTHDLGVFALGSLRRCLVVGIVHLDPHLLDVCDHLNDSRQGHSSARLGSTPLCRHDTLAGPV